MATIILSADLWRCMLTNAETQLDERAIHASSEGAEPTAGADRLKRMKASAVMPHRAGCFVALSLFAFLTATTKLARRGRDGPRDDGRSSAAGRPCGRALAAVGSEVMRVGRLATTDEAWLLGDRAKVQSGRPRFSLLPSTRLLRLKRDCSPYFRTVTSPTAATNQEWPSCDRPSF
jgi:hypothetical protein